MPGKAPGKKKKKKVGINVEEPKPTEAFVDYADLEGRLSVFLRVVFQFNIRFFVKYLALEIACFCLV